ncbi:hypothetical protein M501DRAFT_523587 [Patellaria atrata CBS 101060]|uniref:Uncharacterized protein n=1 Tax=Patellaria atrata CBS 101060 TaxID=1346257 RepID=A0A9P4VLX0_9PEZI|nr:hypothetical protein M501DRAFT_523587 [Patellaria atrata CBS 101060]
MECRFPFILNLMLKSPRIPANGLERRAAYETGDDGFTFLRPASSCENVDVGSREEEVKRCRTEQAARSTIWFRWLDGWMAKATREAFLFAKEQLLCHEHMQDQDSTHERENKYFDFGPNIYSEKNVLQCKVPLLFRPVFKSAIQINIVEASNQGSLRPLRHITELLPRSNLAATFCDLNSSTFR